MLLDRTCKTDVCCICSSSVSSSSYEFEAIWDCVTSVDLPMVCIRAYYSGLSLLVYSLFDCLYNKQTVNCLLSGKCSVSHAKKVTEMTD